MSCLVSVTHSASREIGTQTSVTTTLAPARYDSCAQNTSWRACQRRVRSSASLPIRTDRRRTRATISPKRSDCSATPASVPWNSRNSIGCLGQAELRVGVADANLHLVEKLDAGHAECRPGSPRWPRRSTPRSTGNGHTPADDRLGNAVQLQGQLGDDAERTLGADDQPGEIIAGRRICARAATSTSARRSAARPSAPAHCPSSCRSARRSCPRRASRPCRRARHRRRDRPEKNRPWSRRCSLSCLRVTPGSTTQSKSSG